MLEIHRLYRLLKAIFIEQDEFETSMFTVRFNGKIEKLKQLVEQKTWCSITIVDTTITITLEDEPEQTNEHIKPPIFNVLYRTYFTDEQWKHVTSYGIVSGALINSSQGLSNDAEGEWHLVSIPDHAAKYMKGFKKLARDLAIQIAEEDGVQTFDV